MTLLTAHRILIATSVAFFMYYSFWEFWGVHAGSGPGGSIRAALAVLAALGLLVYLWSLRPSRGAGRSDRNGGV